ncbi:unnamed protein product, partial [Ectocarpus sp. 12 AP-2014]
CHRPEGILARRLRRSLLVLYGRRKWMDGPPFVCVFLRCPWVCVVEGGLRVVGGPEEGAVQRGLPACFPACLVDRHLLTYLPPPDWCAIMYFCCFLGAEVG